MIGVSFAMTSDAYADGTKTETRRFWKPAHAAKFRSGTVFMGWTKDPRAGGMRMHAARVVECYRERLGDMSEYSFSAEGGTRYWADRAAYIEMMGGADEAPWVLRFEHLPNGARVSGEPEARLRAAGSSAEPAMLAGASPDSSAGVAEPHCPDAKRPGNAPAEARVSRRLGPDVGGLDS